MLPLAELLKEKSEVTATYNQNYATMALHEYVDSFDEGRDILVNAIQQFANDLYGRSLRRSGKPFFLDKTPRYYFIIPELMEIFPQAKLVLLVRNPLAVFSSILRTNMHGDWVRLFSEPDRRADIFEGPRRMRDAITSCKDQIAVVHYEDLVTNPDSSLQSICEHIGVRFDPTMLDYGEKVNFPGTTWIDPKSIYRHSSPVTDYRDAWLDTISSHQQLTLLRGYLNSLGESLVDDLGYSFHHLHTQLDGVESRIDKSPERIVSWATACLPQDPQSLRTSSERATRLAVDSGGVTGAFSAATQMLKGFLSALFRPTNTNNIPL